MAKKPILSTECEEALHNECLNRKTCICFCHEEDRDRAGDENNEEDLEGIL